MNKELREKDDNRGGRAKGKSTIVRERERGREIHREQECVREREVGREKGR